MKKALSLILAVLMIAGCMSLSISALQFGDLIYPPEIIKDGKVDAIILDTPIATPPVSDGVVSDGEYNWHNTISAANAAEYLSLGAFAEGESVDEHLAFDADWIYYAVEINFVDYVGKELYVNIGTDVSNCHTTGQMANFCINGLWNNGGNPVAWYGEGTNGKTAVGASDHVTSRLGDLSVTDDAVWKMKYNEDKTVFEFAFARKYFYSRTDLYGLKTLINPNGWNSGGHQRIHICNVLSDTEKTAMGVTTGLAPRYLWIAGNWDPISVLEGNGTEHIKLAAPVATAPVVDGVISAGEYTKTVETTLEAGVLNDTVVELNNETVKAVSGKFVEYFAYDADYIYYAIEATNGASLGGNYLFQFREASRNLSPVDLASLAFNRNSGSWFTYNYHQIADSGFIFQIEQTPVGVERGATKFARQMAGYGFTSPTNVNLEGWSLGRTQYSAINDKLNADFFELTVNDIEKAGTKPTDTDKKVFEIKISREQYDSDAYAFLSGPYCGGIRLGNALTAEDKAELNNTTASFAPRYILIGDEDVTTKGTASVRISGSHDGLRFKTKISNELIADLKAQGYTLEVGTLIAATDTLGENALTHAYAGTKLDVVGNIDAPFAEGDRFNTYAGSITDIKPGNLSRDFTAVGYLKATKAGEDPVYYYSKVAAKRNVSAVATAALGDSIAWTAPTPFYPYVAAAYDDTKNVYSPYTADQRAILDSLISAY